MRQPGPGSAAVQLLGLQKEGMVESRPRYLCDIPHLLGGNGHQPLYTVLLHLSFLLDDLLHDVVDVHLALRRNLGASMAGGSRGGVLSQHHPPPPPSPALQGHLVSDLLHLQPLPILCTHPTLPVSRTCKSFLLAQSTMSREGVVWATHEVLHTLNRVRLESPRGKFTLPFALVKDLREETHLFLSYSFGVGSP